MTNYISDIAKVDKTERFNAIINVLKQNNVDYEIQNIPGYKTTGNIIVKAKASNQNKVVVSAHYDNFDGTPGANDNAAACSILLNLILNTEQKDNVEYVFFDLEEHGFAGSRHYLSLNAKHIAFVINLDMCGIGENILLCKNFTNESVNEIINNHEAIEVKMLPPGDAYNFMFQNINTLYIVNSTNHDIEWFKEYAKNGFPSGTAPSPDFLETMHQASDTIDNINITQVEKIYNFVSDLIASLNASIVVGNSIYDFLQDLIR